MRSIVLGIIVYMFTACACAQGDIRKIDFKNFTYPLKGPLLGHSSMSWLGDPGNGYSKRPPIHLVYGEDASGFTFDSVQYAYLAGTRQEDAIVVLTYHTGGTQTTNYIYIYSLDKAGKPSLLDFCYTGDRTYSGLYKVYGKDGKLVVDLLDPRQNSGDCCSSGFVETRYQWQRDRFVRVGPVTHGTVK